MLIYLDIETVANPNLPPALLDNLMDIQPDSRLKDPEKIRESINDKRIKLLSTMGLSPLTGKICCVSLEIENEDGEGEAVLDTTIFNEDEKVILEAILDALDRFSANYVMDSVVTFNGKEFDLPFIKTRFAVHGIFSRRLKLITDTSRYNQDTHFDIYAHLSNFGTFPKGTLTQWAAALGVIQTIPEDDGSKIQEWYDNKEYEKITSKCEADRKLNKAIYKAITGKVRK